MGNHQGASLKTMHRKTCGNDKGELGNSWLIRLYLMSFGMLILALKYF